MYEDFAPRLAQVITEFSMPVQKGDLVGILGSTEAEPLLRALHEAVVRRGGHPFVIANLPGLDEVFLRQAADHQLDYLNPVMMELIERVDVLYQVIAPSNTRSMSGIDPARIARRQQARGPFVRRYLERCGDGSLRWNITAWPTQAAAQQAEMGLLAYTEFMYKACALDQPDPIAYWEALRERQARLVDWLKGKQRCEVRGPGIELTFEFGGRTWDNSWGDNNFPSGEIFTSPIEATVNGHVAFSFPTVYGGHEVSGVKLRFEDGLVVEASAAKGEAFLLSQLDLDEGARMLGEFAIGTNTGIQQFTGETLFDEKIGGTVHMALGESFAELGGTNRSQVHWDMVHDMKQGGEIHIDGELFYQNGQFVIE